MALLAATNLGTKLLLNQSDLARSLLRSVTSRRKARCELGVVSVVIALLNQNQELIRHLCPYIKLDLNAQLQNVS